MRTVHDFRQTLIRLQPVEYWSAPLKALWWQAKGQWHQAHAQIDHLDDRDSAHVHAYLHRVEGDLWNARYWYGRAHQPPFEGPLETEWGLLVEKFISG